MKQSFARNMAPIVLRIGLAMVICWFGFNELLHPEMWLSYIPSFATSLLHVSTHTLVILNGWFEVVMATLLACGVCIRLVASLLCAHMLFIVFDVGLSAVGVRDVGLTFGLFSVALHGSDML